MPRVTRKLAAWSDSVNLFLVMRDANKIRGPAEVRTENRRMLENAVSRSPDPVCLYLYLTRLVIAWSTFVLPFGVLMVGISYLGDRLGAAHVGLAVGLFPNVFCLAGGADALWRRPFAKRARTLYLAAGHRLDPETRELIRIARANDGTLLLQLFVAICISVSVGL